MNNFRRLLKMAIEEDLGRRGDVTSSAIFGDESTRASIASRQSLRLAGLSYCRAVFQRIDRSLRLESLKSDGDDIEAGDEVLIIEGRTASMLRAERIALNFLAYLSGIATQTRAFVTLAAQKGNTVILDTRKTLPGYRVLAKEAVRLGGGQNHRMGLFDMVLIKDNHIDAAGGIDQAVSKVRSRWGKKFRIELECRNLVEVRKALSLGVDVIMLDNMNVEDSARAVAMRKEDFPGSSSRFEASGDMDTAKLESFAGIGLDYISVGRLTHSVSSANFTMRIADPARK